jgi:hypothetical protein
MDVPHDGTREGRVAGGEVWGNIGCLPPVHLVFALGCAAHDGERHAQEQVADTMIKAGICAILTPGNSTITFCHGRGDATHLRCPLCADLDPRPTPPGHVERRHTRVRHRTWLVRYRHGGGERLGCQRPPPEAPSAAHSRYASWRSCSCGGASSDDVTALEPVAHLCTVGGGVAGEDEKGGSAARLCLGASRARDV